MRKTSKESDPFADELGDDLDFNINITAQPDQTQDQSSRQTESYEPKVGWVPLSSNATEESKRESFRSANFDALPSMQSQEHIHEEGLVDTLFANSLNPVACLFHVLFKGASILSFVFLNAFLNEEILTFIIVVVFAAFDFWTVKNITGRLLVNLRWDSYIDQFGNEIYVYESDDKRKEQQAAAMVGDVEAQQRFEAAEAARVGKSDSRIFWTGTYSAPAIWFVLLLMQIMKFNFFWMVTASICFSLSFTNAHGFYYCQKSHTAKLAEYIQQRGLNMFREATRSTLMPSFMSGFSLPSIFRRGGGSGADK